FLFFFQAEDGIRDYKVTGVQTCALPIWRRPSVMAKPSSALPTRASPLRMAYAAPELRDSDRGRGRTLSMMRVVLDVPVSWLGGAFRAECRMEIWSKSSPTQGFLLKSTILHTIRMLCVGS